MSMPGWEFPMIVWICFWLVHVISLAWEHPPTRFTDLITSVCIIATFCVFWAYIVWFDSGFNTSSFAVNAFGLIWVCLILLSLSLSGEVLYLASICSSLIYFVVLISHFNTWWLSLPVLNQFISRDTLVFIAQPWYDWEVDILTCTTFKPKLGIYMCIVYYIICSKLLIIEHFQQQTLFQAWFLILGSVDFRFLSWLILNIFRISVAILKIV